MKQSDLKTLPSNMSQNSHFNPCLVNQCDCKKTRTGRHREHVKEDEERNFTQSQTGTGSLHISFSSPPASPPSPPLQELSESDIAEVLSQSELESEPIIIPTTSEREEILDQVSESLPQPDIPDDSQPMILDEDASDGWGERYKAKAVFIWLTLKIVEFFLWASVLVLLIANYERTALTTDMMKLYVSGLPKGAQLSLNREIFTLVVRNNNFNTSEISYMG